MVDLVLEDSLIRDLLDDAIDPAQQGSLAGSALRLKAATPVLATVSPSILHEGCTCHQLDNIRYCIPAVLVPQDSSAGCVSVPPCTWDGMPASQSNS